MPQENIPSGETNLGSLLPEHFLFKEQWRVYDFPSWTAIKHGLLITGMSKPVVFDSLLKLFYLQYFGIPGYGTEGLS